MIRTPLRPLARILDARLKGENPDVIEKENLAIRHEAMRDRARIRAERRLFMLGFGFFMAFTVIGARMGTLAASEPTEPRASVGGTEITAQRADILDRQGRILATNMLTYSLYAQPRDMVDPVHAATELAAIFPELDPKALERRFTDGRSFLWVRKVMSPEQMQQVHEIGDPGLYFGPREMRLYPNGNLAIRGEKMLTLNQGEEVVQISGVIRPEDIQADNSIFSSQVADAKITYAGNGALADANTIGWLGRFFLSALFPF